MLWCLTNWQKKSLNRYKVSAKTADNEGSTVGQIEQSVKTAVFDADMEAVLAVLSRSSFWAFCCYWDWDFFRVRRRFLKEVALLFQELADEYERGVALTVGVSMPPRAGKSYITSLFAAWWLGRFNTLSVMRNACTASLYQEFSYTTRAIVSDQRYYRVFGVKLRKDKSNLDGWSLETSKQVGYFGGGVGTSIIGKGANLAITDDLYSGMKDALSDTVQKSTDMWKSSEHNSRMEKNCPEIFIGTRWTKSDVIGKALESGKIQRYISIPAMVDGKSFCEDVKSTDEYLAIMQEEGEESLTWQAEYMQQPIEAKGLLLPASELMFDDITLDPRLFPYRFAVVDPADKGGDKFAVPYCFVSSSNNGLKVYVIDAMCNTDGIMANSPRVADRCRSYAIEDLFVESNGVGLASVVDLHNKIAAFTNLRPFASTEEKEVRILSNFEFIKSHFVFSSKIEDEYKTFLGDLTSYVRGASNNHRRDAIDVLSRAAEIVKLKFFEQIYT